MFDITGPETVVDLMTQEKLVLSLYKSKDKVDIAGFLDDVSIWMDKNRELITQKYLPFCILSVGINPTQVSSFMYGMFIGKALEKHKLDIRSAVTKLTKEEIEIELKRNSFHGGLLGPSILGEFKENNDGDNQQGKRK